MDKISYNKAVSWDLIPDSIISAAHNDEELMDSIFKILSNLVQVKGFSKTTFTGRLMVLNKNPGETPNINALRPINITSVLLKIWESIILAKMKAILSRNKLNHALLADIDHNQTGF